MKDSTMNKKQNLEDFKQRVQSRKSKLVRYPTEEMDKSNISKNN